MVRSGLATRERQRVGERECVCACRKSTKTGSACCVASRPRRSCPSSARASDGGSSSGPHHRCRDSNEDHSVSFSSTWDPSSRHQQYQYHHHHQDLSSTALFSSSSQRYMQQPPSSLSRNASHAGSSLANEPFLHHHHHRGLMADDRSFSSSSSPLQSFGSPNWTSRDVNLAAFTCPSSDSFVRTHGQVLSKEGHVQTRTLTLPEAGFMSTLAATSGRTSFHRNLSGTSSSSKIGFFRRQKSESGTFPQGSPSEERIWSQTSGYHGGMDWPMQAFSQLVARSHREAVGMLDNNMDANNFVGSPDELGASSLLERMRIRSLYNPHCVSPDVQGDVQTCGICCRWLLHRSPWSSHRMLIGSIDLPVVGILVCGHVFHADCLEKAIPETLRHDPPCPHCHQDKDVCGKAHTCESPKPTKEPVKSKLSKIGPQLWKRPFSSANLDRRKEGFFQRSFSRKHFPFLTKAGREGSLLSASSRKGSSAAQVSPENQI